jgi:hypothetical protein
VIFSAKPEIKTYVEPSVLLVDVYPNPSKGNVNIDFKDSFSNDFSFVICDYIGRKVLESKILQSKTLVNLEYLSSGLYTITISNDQSDIVCRKSIYKD